MNEITVKKEALFFQRLKAALDKSKTIVRSCLA